MFRELFGTQNGGVRCRRNGGGGRSRAFILSPHTCWPPFAMQTGRDCGFIFTLSVI